MSKQFYQAKNVNDAFLQLVQAFDQGQLETITTTSRNGPVMQAVHPVTICYDNPRQRVLFNAGRDANPFFHLYESLYMLSGGKEIGPLAYYASNMKNYSDDGVTQNGAYGYRWRTRASQDQLSILLNHLKEQPNSRRAVLQMWTIKRDLFQIDKQFEGQYTSSGRKLGMSKDVCCNLCCTFLLRDCPRDHNNDDDCDRHPQGCPKYLDMTVFNRSNDLIWGALGANVVHFSFLQEYMANCLGVQVGRYYQVSSNMHVYTDNWEPGKWLKYTHQTYNSTIRPWSKPLVKDRETFDMEVQEFVDHYPNYNPKTVNFEEPFLEQVAKPMCLAFAAHKDRNYPAAYALMNRVEADDWRIAGSRWIEKRETNWSKKNNG